MQMAARDQTSAIREARPSPAITRRLLTALDQRRIIIGCQEQFPTLSVLAAFKLREDDMADRETGDLIGTDKVEGTAVYGVDREKIGSIERVMLEKVSGKASYAVLSFGGFLGIGDDHYPIPWQNLKYDTNLGGYLTNVTKQQLQDAPKYSNEADWDWRNTAHARSLNDYYGMPLV
jgi:PRC-barrel domain